ncbi:MAG: alpha/beta fold hydrolase [Myxococcota bacterium]
MTRRILLGVYVILLVASTLMRPADFLPVDGQSAVRLPGQDLRIAWWDLPAEAPEATADIILIHGSPGAGADQMTLARSLPETTHRYALDMPGFGGSTRYVADYSVRAHAQNVLDWMDAVGLEDAHFVVHSMGGGVALETIAKAPTRVRSLTMICAIGAVELELLGDQTINHGIHGMQLLGIQALTALTPHFGALDRFALNVSYARNFYDTDQSRLRPILSAMEQPLLIVHGETDPLVPVEAAREHHRIVPHSELVVLPTDHFLVFRPDEAQQVADIVADFIERVDDGEAQTRTDATPAQRAAARAPFDFDDLPEISGPGLLVTGALLAVATFFSEDLTNIAAGLMVANHRLDFWFAAIACTIGIFLGDVLLVLVGRTLGRAALHRAPLRWLVSEAAIDQASDWYGRNGAQVIFTSRFTPGMRLPMYVAAGILRTPLMKVTLWLLVASVLWTPPIIYLAAILGEPALAWVEGAQNGVLWLIGFGLLMVGALRVGAPLVRWRGRRLARAWLLRQVRWEYWPAWRVYGPVVLRILPVAWKHRSLTAFTAVNPGMPAGGVVGESKWDIYQRMGGRDQPFLPNTALLRGDRLADALAFVEDAGWPVVLKPDAGQRGQGVAVVRSEAALRAYLDKSEGDVLVQAYIPGVEFGVFYVRHPDAAQGRVFSITAKHPVAVTGDGERTLETLILCDDEILPKAPLHLAVHAPDLMTVPADGAQVNLVEVGTHARGARFLDAGDLNAPALEAVMDRISKQFDGGFFFGRYDVRVPSAEALTAGEGVMIIEANGVTSEATHIFDPKHSARYGRQVLTEQWTLAFDIGAANIRRGAKETSLSELWAMYRTFQREALAGHAPVDEPLKRS